MTHSSHDSRSWKLLLVGVLISCVLIQEAHCDDPTSTTAAPTKQQDKKKLVKVIHKTPVQSTKPIIVVAEKVENPPNWNSWTPVKENSTNWVPTQAPQTTPLSLEEQHKRIKQHQIQQDKREAFAKNNVKKAQQQQQHGTKTKVKPMENWKSQAMHYGKMLLTVVGGSGLGGRAGEFARLASMMIPDQSASGSAPDSSYSTGGPSYNSFGEFQSEDHSDSSSRSALGWLSRLIGIQGKTLGEFLREYQVHVLYDLLFIFAKWIFFVYAGLLIP